LFIIYNVPVRIFFHAETLFCPIALELGSAIEIYIFLHQQLDRLSGRTGFPHGRIFLQEHYKL
jgi:hypothetical protein